MLFVMQFVDDLPDRPEKTICEAWPDSGGGSRAQTVGVPAGGKYMQLGGNTGSQQRGEQFCALGNRNHGSGAE